MTKKLSKSAVGFEHPAKHAQQCARCVHFVQGKRACKIVAGLVMPADWCKKWKANRLQNYGEGDLFNFHGAFDGKKDAEAKESKTPGGFIKTMWYRTGPRYAVLTNRNPEPCGKKLGNGFTCSRKPHHRGPCLPQGVTLRPKSRIPHHWIKRQNSRDTELFHQALKSLFPNRKVEQLSRIQLSQVLAYAQDLKVGKRNPSGIPSKRNYADATELYTKFHGKEPRRVTNTGLPTADYNDHDELAQLGKLVSLTIGADAPKKWRKKITWGAREAPDLAADPGGQQLFIIRGSQNLDAALPTLPVETGKQKIDLGILYQVEYFTQKKFDNFQPVTYYHDLGEETGERPRAVYDRNEKRIHIVGGAYKVKPEGIVN